MTTPNILTEVSSFINQLNKPERSSCYILFASGVAALQEFYVFGQAIASADWSFLKYGLAGCGIVSLAKDHYLVLTKDMKLINYLCTQDIDTINFNHRVAWLCGKLPTSPTQG